MWFKRREGGANSSLGLLKIVDRCKNKQTKLQRHKRPHQILVTQTDVSSLVGWSVRLGFLAVGIVIGFGFGLWYRGLNGGGGDAIQTVQGKMVPAIQKVIKPAPPETPPEKWPLVQPARVESRAVVITPVKAETTGAVLQKPAVSQKQPEPMSPAKLLLIQLEGKLLKQ